MFINEVKNIPFDSQGNFCMSIFQNRSNEDWSTIAKIGKDCYYYAVFDGHGNSTSVGGVLDGKHCAIYLKDYLHHLLALSLEGIKYNNREEIKKAIQECFVKVDSWLYEKGGTYGSTASLVLVTPINVIHVNLGDSCSIKIEKVPMNKKFMHKIVFKTKLHNAVDEVERIESAGGYVKGKRLQDIYLPSRSFGDFDAKIVDGEYNPEGPMSCIPDIYFQPLKKGIIILGSDGLFDGFQNINTITEIIGKTKEGEKISSKLCNYSCNFNYNDDITCVVIFI